MNRPTDRRPPEPRRLRILATDYDGTLATDGRVDGPTWAALARWRASGRRAILVTGREYDELAAICPGLDRFDRIVAENGGHLVDPATGVGRLLAAPPPARFVAALRARGVGPIATGRAVVAAREPHRPAIEAAIRELGLPLRVIANKRALMVLPLGVDKGTGLRAALAELGADAAAVVGVGDAENDEALLAASGFGVAVANALPALRALADLVTAGERGLGVAELVDGLLAGDPRP